MHPVKIDVFFSCSFADADREVNDYFLAICQALDMNCTNVATAFAKTPPEVAKTLIGNAQALVAVCTRRHERGDDRFDMPDAVHDEISFAFGKDVPVLLLVEDGVELLGFKQNFGTHLRFKRNELHLPTLLRQVIEGIHGLKLQIVSPHDLLFDQDINEFYAEHMYHQVELRLDGAGQYTWAYSITKKLIFNKPYKKSFITGVWATVPSVGCETAPPLTLDLEVESSSRGSQVATSIEKQTADCVELRIKLDPPAEPGDSLEYSTTTVSPLLNPIWAEDVAPGAAVHLDSEEYLCADGIVPIQRTKRAKLEFRFPKAYGLKRHDIRPFVGSYTSRVDYEVESEAKRMKTEIESYGGNLVIRLEIDSPLLRHMYGIAWNPKPKPAG